MNRRDVLAAFGGVAAARAFGLPGALGSDGIPDANAETVHPPVAGAPFPRADDFAIEHGYTYLNAAYTHPIPRVSVQAARRAAELRGVAGGRLTNPPAPAATPRELFAKLINAKPSEIAHVSSTSDGENMVVRALGLDHRVDGNVVTDGLHFEGSLMHLLELKKRGLDVRIVAPTKDARIDMRDLERAVDTKTRLVEISATAMYNGFQHDLHAVSELAHANGAYVYADIVHAVGAEPFDVKASGIDFASCSSFKWLMGDFGLGFLYASERVFGAIERPVCGYYQAANLESNYPPHLPPAPYAPVEYTLDRTAAGMFETGSLTGTIEVNLALLTASLSYVQALGVQNIQAHRLPLIRRLQKEVPRFGFTNVTPPDSTGAIVTFARANVGESDVPKRLAAAKLNVRLARHWLRVSPSVYNDMGDVERLLEALG